MKLRNLIILALVLVLLWGCAPAETPTEPTGTPTTGPAPTTPPTTAPTTEPVVNPTTEPTTQPTTEPIVDPVTDPTEMNNPFAWGYFDEITVHPFSQTEMAAALNALNNALATTSTQEGVLNFEAHWVSFDPYYTAQCVKNQMDLAPVEGWTAEDYFARKMLFVVNFTVAYDHTLSAATDYENQLGVVALVRDSVDGEWTIDVDGCAPYTFCEPSEMLVPPQVLEAMKLTQEFTLAAYHDADVGEYFLYVLDESGSQVICRSFHAAKPN